MITLCYIILAHNNLQYLAELINFLADDYTGFIVHIDSKCKEALHPIMNLSKRYYVNILNTRHDIKWGDKSMVDLVNLMCQIALEDDRKYDYFILLSGQDLPLKSPEYIRSYIGSHGVKNYLLAAPMLTKECRWQEMGRRRLECYAIRLRDRDISTIEPLCFNWKNIKQIIKTIAYGNASSIRKMVKYLFSKRRNGIGLIPYGGEFWWRMNRYSLNKIIDYIKSHRNLEKELEFTAHPDEVIYNTLVYNLCDNTENSLLTFINWNGRKSPDWITLDDKYLIESLISNPDMLFCRKVKDLKLVKYVKSHIDTKSITY